MTLPKFDRSRLLTDDTYLDETCRRVRDIRELDARENNGIKVRLFWDKVQDKCYVHVTDGDDTFTLEVEEWQKPQDVFQHPFAHR